MILSVLGTIQDMIHVDMPVADTVSTGYRMSPPPLLTPSNDPPTITAPVAHPSLTRWRLSISVIPMAPQFQALSACVAMSLQQQ